MDPEVLSDVEEAIRRVREGRAEAYETVVRAFQARLRASVAYLSPPGVDADEIAHRAFVEAFRRIDDYRSGTQFYAWLSAIARALVLGELRRMRREAARRERYLERVVAEAAEADLEGGDDLGERRVRALRECLGSLPAELRELLEMRYSGDASIADIARRTGRSGTAVKVRLFDLRRRLRDCVDRRLAWERA
jgi:RNA polymerase sigma-70 factor (ECF subfamily)